MSNDKDTAAPSADANTLKSNEVARTVLGTGAKVDGFRVDFRDGTATLTGGVSSEDERKRVVDAAHTVGGVASVKDSLHVGGGAATGGGTGGGGTYTVKAGDTLSQIAQTHYGKASDSKRIFEANRNTLSDPDKIQVGQVLVLP